MRTFLPLLTASLLFFVILTVPVAGEDEAPKTGSFRVDLPSGIHYFCHVPDNYEPGRTGIAILFHGRGGSGEDMLSFYRDSGMLKDYNWIGIAPKSPDLMWEAGHKGGMDSLNDVMKKYKVDKNRVHILGFSAGGLYTAWMGLSNLGIFRTIVVSGACLDNGPIGNVKKNLNMPIYLINGETCQYVDAARSNFESLVRFGCRYARRRVHKGEGHSYDINKDVPFLREWYTAVESGYDYPAALDKATKDLKGKVEKAIATVKEIESHPREEGFWAELAAIKTAINEQGEKKLKQILTRNKNAPAKAIPELKALATTFEGYPCADAANEELAKLEPEGEGEKE